MFSIPEGRPASFLFLGKITRNLSVVRLRHEPSAYALLFVKSSLIDLLLDLRYIMAESVGFEPTADLNSLRLLSRKVL